MNCFLQLGLKNYLLEQHDLLLDWSSQSRHENVIQLISDECTIYRLNLKNMSTTNGVINLDMIFCWF